LAIMNNGESSLKFMNTLSKWHIIKPKPKLIFLFPNVEYDGNTN
jgi:hypothetical protein